MGETAGAKYVKIWPVHASDGWKGGFDPKGGWVVDKEKCYEYVFMTLEGQRCSSNVPGRGYVLSLWSQSNSRAVTVCSIR